MSTVVISKVQKRERLAFSCMFLLPGVCPRGTPVSCVRHKVQRSEQPTRGRCSSKPRPPAPPMDVGRHVQSELPLKGVTPAPSPLPAASTLNTELRHPAVSCWRSEGLFLGYSLCTRGPLVEGTVTSVPGTGEQGLELTASHEHAQTTAAC